MLNKQDISNIINLIKLAPITGEQSIAVAVILQKLDNLLKVPDAPKQEIKNDVKVVKK